MHGNHKCSKELWMGNKILLEDMRYCVEIKSDVHTQHILATFPVQNESKS